MFNNILKTGRLIIYKSFNFNSNFNKRQTLLFLKNWKIFFFLYLIDITSYYNFGLNYICELYIKCLDLKIMGELFIFFIIMKFLRFI